MICTYHDGQSIEISVNNFSIAEILTAYIPDEQFEFYLDNIDHEVESTKAFRYDENDLCLYFEYKDINRKTRRFYFEEPKYWKVYIGNNDRKLHDVLFGSKKKIEFDLRQFKFQGLELSETHEDVFEVHQALFSYQDEADSAYYARRNQ